MRRTTRGFGLWKDWGKYQWQRYNDTHEMDDINEGDRDYEWDWFSWIREIDMNDPGSAPRAISFYEINVARTKEAPSRLAVRRRLWTTILALLDPSSGILSNGREPEQESVVEVRKKSDGCLMISYEYSQEMDAVFHRNYLRERAERLSIAEFDRELGLTAHW